MQSFATLRTCEFATDRRMKNAIPVMNGWPIQAVFWLEWGSSTAGPFPLRFAEHQVNMLRHDHVPVKREA
jgi:hypothetical protein